VGAARAGPNAERFDTKTIADRWCLGRWGADMTHRIPNEVDSTALRNELAVIPLAGLPHLSGGLSVGIQRALRSVFD